MAHREMLRLYTVLDSALEGRDYLVGDRKGKYSIADMACWTQVNSSIFIGIGDLGRWPNLEAWSLRIEQRDAVKKAMEVPFKREYSNSSLKHMLAEGGGFAQANEVLQSALKQALEEYPER
jgi:hypothetical protein